MAFLHKIYLQTCHQLKMLQFATDVLNLESFNQNGYCGFYLGQVQFILIETRGYQHQAAMDAEFELELAPDDCLEDLVARASFSCYRDSCQKDSSIIKRLEYKFRDLIDVDGRVWRIFPFSSQHLLDSSQQISNVRMF
jgi:hypothetical protein